MAQAEVAGAGQGPPPQFPPAQARTGASRSAARDSPVERRGRGSRGLPGDLVFAFVDTFISAIGVAQSYCWESPKPAEFGTMGQYWRDVGWKVLVTFNAVSRKVRPKDHIGVLRPLAPARYGPLQANGDG